MIIMNTTPILGIQSTSTQNSTKGLPDAWVLITDSLNESSSYHGKFTDKQINAASEKLNAREQQAFLNVGDGSLKGIKSFTEAYLKYINALSPEEQNSPRYRGTKESATKLLSDVNAEITSGGEPTQKTAKPISLISMMLDEMIKKMQERGVNTQSTFGVLSAASDKVTISKQAQKLNSQS